MYPFKKEEITQKLTDAEDIMPRLRYDGPHQRGIDVADFFGFRLLPPLKIESEDRDAPGPNEQIALIRKYLEYGLDTCTQPVHLCHTHKIPYKQDIHLRLEMLGSDKSIAETILIFTVYTILKEHGFDDPVVVLNSIGDDESARTFSEELTQYCREHLESFDAHCRQALKTDPLALFGCENTQCRDILKDAPPAVAFLSDTSKKHFYEVLEALELLNIPYVIDSCLVRDRDAASHTIFEVRERPTEKGTSPSTVLASGHRYDHLARRASLGRKIPAIGASISTEITRSRKIEEKFQEYKVNRPRNPLAFVVHLGIDAKRGVLKILDELRKESIPVVTALAEDSLRHQLAFAKQLSVPSVVIIGQKEIMEGTAIVRDSETRSQKTVPQAQLPTELARFV